MRLARRRLLTPIAIVLIVGLAAGLTVVNYQFAQASPGGNDFLARWNAASMWLKEGISPYAPQVGLRTQTYIYGRPANLAAGEDLAHFAYPLPSMLFFAPFGLLPYVEARAVWMTLLEMGMALIGVLGVGLARWKAGLLMLILIPVFSVLWYHGIRAIIVGQFAVVEALLLIGALAALQRRRDAWAGVLAALSTCKPQMSFLLIPFILLWSLRARRWRVSLSFTATFVGLMAASFVLLPSWLIDWLRQLYAYPSYTALGSPVSIFVEALPGDPAWLTWLLSSVLVLGLLWEWRSAGGRGDAVFQWTAALTLTITNLVALRTATTHYVVLLPALCLLFAEWDRRWAKRGRAATLIAMLVLAIGLWILFFVTVEANLESAVMYFPVPVIALLGLWWIRWWIYRRSRVSFA